MTKNKKHRKCKRRNFLISKMVNISARLADKGHVPEAAKLCRDLGVSLEVALRVITRPSKRRKT